MCVGRGDRGFFEDLAVSFKSCCERHDIDLEKSVVEFDEFLDEMDKCVTEFLDELGELVERVDGACAGPEEAPKRNGADGDVPEE